MPMVSTKYVPVAVPMSAKPAFSSIAVVQSFPAEPPADHVTLATFAVAVIGLVAESIAPPWPYASVPSRL